MNSLTKLKKSIKTETDVEHLQEDLETLYTWAEENNKKFNGTKFQLIRLGNSSDIKDDTLYFTENMSNIIDQFETIKDLGVVMNDQATFKNHIEKALKKARQKMGWILRTFNSRNKWFMRHMFKSLVLPYIDYCSQWMGLTSTVLKSYSQISLRKSLISEE